MNWVVITVVSHLQRRYPCGSGASCGRWGSLPSLLVWEAAGARCCWPDRLVILDADSGRDRASQSSAAEASSGPRDVSPPGWHRSIAGGGGGGVDIVGEGWTFGQYAIFSRRSACPSFSPPCLSTFQSGRVSVRLSVGLFVCPSVRLSVCPSACLSARLSVRLSICPSVYLSVCLSVCLSICLPVCLTVCQSVHLSAVCLSICLSICLSASLSGRLPVCPSVRLTVCLSVWPSVCLFDRLSVRLSVCTFVRLAVCLSVWPSACPSDRLSVRLPAFLSVFPVCPPRLGFSQQTTHLTSPVCIVIYLSAARHGVVGQRPAPYWPSWNMVIDRQDGTRV